MIAIPNIREAVQALGLSGRPLCVHSSLRSFGWVEGGASTVVDALLAEGCTVMVPTFSYTFSVPPPPELQPARNGWHYDTFRGTMSGIGRVFSPDSVEMDRADMGAIPAAVVAMPGRIRGNHPLDSFAAVGPLAQDLIEGQGPLDVYAPLMALVRAGGAMVMMGVGLDKMTLLHLAEQRAGRKLFIRWANGPDCQPIAVAAGGCSDGFVNLEPVLSHLAQQRTVGDSTWRVYPAGSVLELAARAIREKPELTHCGDPSCERCNDAVLGGPILSASMVGRA